jgi:DNA repair protein RecN (Recombination protein N)
MLEHLAIQDVALVDRLELSLGPGLAVLTGETGAGKSIILDALGLALGARGERSLVRAGAAQGAVAASFRLGQGHPVEALLAAHGLDDGDGVVLRRIVGADGRSRAFVNDQPVGTALLREIGDRLVEVHGQLEQQSVLTPASHRRLLDAFGELSAELAATRAAHAARLAARERAAALRGMVEAAALERDELCQRARELADLAAAPGEEVDLALRRARLMQRDRLVEALRDALAAVGGSGGAVERLAGAERRLARAAGLDEALLAPVAEAIGRAALETAEAEAAIGRALAGLEGDEGGLERLEERLFALRAAARKHRVAVDALPGLLDATQARLAELERAAHDLEAVDRAVAAAERAYDEAAATLTAGRAAAARRLERAVAAELPPLRLEKARFRVALEPLSDKERGADGAERVQLEVATNPGTPFGPLSRIASGGELSRFMLALKVVLARLDAGTTLIFDEVDAGIGGATADAVGERLARLGAERQVLVVTHAPQVAARAHRHLRVTKSLGASRASVAVEELGAAARQEEIARMLAGAAITDAARAAALSLLDAAG